MSSRANLRRRAVLPVTVIRHDGLEKQPAHTLDITENSARLGGLPLPLEPGEVIEIQRGVLKARFQVFWMGASGSPVAGQAGVRSLDSNKRIWGASITPDETDVTVDTGRMRDPMSPVRKASTFPGEKRGKQRYACSGGVSIKTAAATFAMYGEAKDISWGGIYVEMTTPLAVGTQVSMNMTLEGIGLEVTGSVRTSFPLVGMGIRFSNLSSRDLERLALIIGRIQQSETAIPSAPAPVAGSPAIAPAQDLKTSLALLRLDVYPAAVLANACKMLASGFDAWKRMCTPEEVEQVREAVCLLHEKLVSTVSPIELADYFAASGPHDTPEQ